MQNLFLLAGLPGGDQLLAGIFVHPHRSRFREFEIPSGNLTAVNQRKHQTIRQTRPELLHQIQRKRTAPRTERMKKSDRRIQPDRFQRRSAIMRQKSVGERQHCIDTIQRRMLRPAAERKRIPLFYNKI